jgi:hypothetical protein
MVILAIGVLLVVIPAGIINRVLGVPAPIWSGTYTAGWWKRLFSGREKSSPPPAAGLNILLGTGPPLFGTAGAAPGQLGPPGVQSVQPYAPEWYPDPLGNARLRYWDGTRWTDQTAQ